MAPQKMLYIKDEDVGLISKAQECSKENFSNTVIKALKWYVDSQQDIEFELQKVTIGFECAFDYPFCDGGQIVPDELYDNADAHVDLVFDELLPKVFPKIKLTFFGAEIFSCSEKHLAVKNIPALRLHENIIVNAFNGNFKNDAYMETYNTSDFDEDYYDKEIEKMPTEIDFSIFKTRGGKFLILVKVSGLEDLRDFDLDQHYIPDPIDYVVLDQLTEKIDSITTATYGLEIELPKNFMRKIMAAIESANNEKHLDI